MPRIAAVVLLLLGVLCGCASMKPQSRLHDQVPGATMTVAELRIRTRALAAPLSGQLESLTDTIAGDSTDPELRRRMTRFKSESIAQLQSALFQPDPVAAVIDAWALVVQLQHLEQRVYETQSIDEHAHALARRRFVDMENTVAALWQKLTGKPNPGLKPRIHAWAAANPIPENMASRPSTTALVANLTARSGVGLVGSVGQLTEDVQDIVARVDLQTAYLPKQGRWQAEYLVRDLLADPTLLASPGPPAQLFGSLERLTVVAEDMPAVLARERAALYQLLDEQRTELEAFLTSERQAAFDAMKQERVAVLAALDEQRKRAAADVDRVGTRFIDRGFDRSAALADRLLLRLALALALAVVALLALLLAWRHRRHDHRQPTYRESHA